MGKEGTEAEDVADQQAKEQYYQCYRHDGQELDYAAVGMKPRAVGYQESWQEEVVNQIDV